MLIGFSSPGSPHAWIALEALGVDEVSIEGTRRLLAEVLKNG
jgi:hypothetical protein